MGNSIFGASVSLRVMFGNNRELRRRQQARRQALLVNIAMQHQPVEYASILQGIMNEVSMGFAASPAERFSNASRVASMHGASEHSTPMFDVFDGVDHENHINEDDMMATRGRSIFYSLRVTAPNHLPRLLREVSRLTEDCELLADLTWRDHMSYKELCTCASSIEDLKRLADVMIQAGSEQVVKEQVEGRVKASTLAEHERMVGKMQAFAAVMDEYYKSAMGNVDEMGRELSRNRRKREMVRGNLGADACSSSDDGSAPTCVLCCDEEPVGQDNAWVVCTNCKEGFCDKVCWTCTLKLFQMESAAQAGDCPFCRKKLEFANKQSPTSLL